MGCPNCKKDLSVYQYGWIDHTPHEYIEDCNNCGFSVYTIGGCKTVSNPILDKIRHRDEKIDRID